MNIRKTRSVEDVNNEKEYIFTDCTPLEALEKMMYTLNIKGNCNATINKSPSGKHLWFEHRGIVYAVCNE